MAEYYISYGDIENIVDQYISETRDNDLLVKHRAAILAALTGDFEQNNLESVGEMVSLWENQIDKPSQLLLGTRYIRVQHIMLCFLKNAFTSGLIDAVIMYASQGNSSGFTISVGSAVAFTLWDLFNSVKNLDDWDFCIYMQVLTHYRVNRDFTMDELLDWFPKGTPAICNMHNSTWDCDHFRDDICIMVSEKRIGKALQSLCDKGLLKWEMEGGKYIFKFNQ